MSRSGWIAIICAIAFPSIALLIVLLNPPQPPGGAVVLPAPAPPFPPEKGPPGKRPPFPDEVLLELDNELELTDEQVEKIREIGQPARERLGELHREVVELEGSLYKRLEAEDVEIEEVEVLLDQLSKLHDERVRLKVLTPLHLNRVLTAEQRAKLVKVWRRRGGGPPVRSKAPPTGKRPFGHRHFGKGPPLEKGPPFGGPPPFGKGPPPGKAP